LAWIAIFPSIRGILKDVKLTTHPSVIFPLFSTVVWASCIIPATQLLWRKQVIIKKAFGQTSDKPFGPLQVC